jgi:hypothetical protein
MHSPSSDSSPPLIILEKSKHSKNKKKKSRSETSREQNSRSNSRANGSDSDNESSKEATNSTNLTSLLAASNIHTGLNEAAVSPSKGSFPLPENPWANEFECTTSHTHQYCNDYPDHTIDYETAESPSRGSFLLPPLKKTHHENPWASEFDCTISHTHQYCNDYPDLTIDYPYHSLDDDTSEIQGAAAETSDTDTIQSQELLQIRYQLQRGPSSILSRESRLHLRPTPVWRHILQRNNILNDDVHE